MSMDIDQIRRDTLNLWLRGVRLPLTAVEAVTKQDAASWPPALAFSEGEATVKRFVGRLTGDQVLVGLANLQRAEVLQRREALALQADAVATREEARREAEADQAELERRRQQAEARAAERERKAEEDRRRAEAEVARKEADAKAAARKQAGTRQDAIDAAATKAEAARLRKEQQALRSKEQAVAAQRNVLDLDDKVRAKKAARKAG
jgi:hypothetical protein